MAMALRCFRHLHSLLYCSPLVMIRRLPQAAAGCPAPLLEGYRQCVRQVMLTQQLATKKGTGSHSGRVCNPWRCCQILLKAELLTPFLSCTRITPT